MKHAAATGKPVCLDLPFNSTKEEIVSTSGLQATCPSISERIASLVNQGIEIARPVLFYQKAPIRQNAEGKPCIDDIPLEGTLPLKNLADSPEAVLFIASCGSELHSWMESLKDYFNLSVAGIVAEKALQSAMKALFKTMKTEYGSKNLAIMSPGSVPEWPLAEQEKIFHFLGDAAEDKGISLRASCMTAPLKTVSGILFTGEQKLVSCDWCSFKDCSLRHSGFYEENTLDEKEKPCCG